MVNTEKDITMPSKIVLVAKESLENKDITSYITNWFKRNTDISKETGISSSSISISCKEYFN